MNERLIKIFSEMAFYEDWVLRPFPAKAYRNAISIFKNLEFEIDSADQIKGIFGIGKGILEKVNSFLKTGTFPRYEEYKVSDAARCMEIAIIKGFGTNKAKKLYKAGIKSLTQLKEIVKDLKVGQPLGDTGFNYTKGMKIGLDYEAHTDKTRMTVEQHDLIANPLLEKIKTFDCVIQCEAVGSRRRFNGAIDYTIGDIDIIIQVKNKECITSLKKELAALLDDVTMEGDTKVSGIKDRRQVDFRMVTDGYGALKLHATGPVGFNVACRKIAIKNNWILNEYGLFNSQTKECIEKDSEEKILDILGIGWINPQNRKDYK